MEPDEVKEPEATPQPRIVINDFNSPEKSWGVRLPSRESEILKLITEGWRNKEIAESLGITKRTVDYHVGKV